MARESIDALGSGAARAPGSGHRVRLYNRLVAWSKIILPAAVLAVIAAFYLASRGGDPLEKIFSPEDLATLGAGLKLENPRFAGVTRDGEAFAIRADWAVPDSAMPRVIDLERPQGEFELTDGRQINVTATTGRMRREEKVLTFSGKVVLDTSDGYHVETAELEVDLKRKTARTPGPVTGEGPSGRIEAGSFRAGPGAGEGSARQLWFENGVRVVLNPGK
ncbi:MAG: LPS export ABC transporter periplasmic protein LptC [Paracoccaceae bacterium]|nr:LPS export ABC transporter periplasmic protein LptC [Paracoccaceae bacterium]